MQSFTITIWKRLVAIFVTGLIVILPLVLTIAIVAWVTSFLQSYVGQGTFLGKLLASVGIQFGSHGTLAYIIGWGCVLAAIFGLGLLAEMGAKRYFNQLSDGVMKRVPVIGGIYGSLKQLVGIFEKSEESDLKSMSVVFVYFGSREGAGVLALMPSSEKFRFGETDYHVVIIPTAPVPFGGGLLFVPTNLVMPMKMSVDGLMSIYVSMGVTTPEFLAKMK